MNVERLNAIAQDLRTELRELSITEAMGALQSALTNQNNSPQEVAYQQQLATALQALQDKLRSASSNDFPATWRQVIEELGVDLLLGGKLLDRINDVFERNQITVAIALQEVTQLSTDVQNLSTALDQLVAGLAYFGVGREDLKPGEAEVSVMIPRAAVSEELPSLGQEFRDLQGILGPFLELGEGSRPPLKVRAIASSDFAVYVAMLPGAALSVATAMDKLLGVYKNLLEVRQLRQQMSNQGLPDAALASVDEHANTMMAEGTERIANELVDASVQADAGRAHELKIELRLSLNSLANRIDQGYNIDVRAEPEAVEDIDGEDQEGPEPSGRASQLRRINDLGPNLAFVNPAGRPILSLPEASTISEEPDTPEPT